MDCGPDSKGCVRVVSNYAFSIGKSVRQDNSYKNGKRKKCVCSDGVNCSWQLTARKKMPSASGRTTSELFAIPVGHWYVCGMSGDHDKDCISQPTVNKNELKMLDGLIGAFTSGFHTSRKRVVSSVGTVHKVDVSSDSRKSMIYRAIRENDDERQQLRILEYALIPPFLRSLKILIQEPTCHAS